MNMKPEDWFGVGVRLFGVWCGINALQNFAYFVDLRWQAFRLRSPDRDSIDAYANLAYAFLYAALALYFLLKTKHLTDFAYHHSADEPNPPKPD